MHPSFVFLFFEALLIVFEWIAASHEGCWSGFYLHRLDRYPNLTTIQNHHLLPRIIRHNWQASPLRFQFASFVLLISSS